MAMIVPLPHYEFFFWEKYLKSEKKCVGLPPPPPPPHDLFQGWRKILDILTILSP